MINLKKDLFARLVISARKFKLKDIIQTENPIIAKKSELAPHIEIIDYDSPSLEDKFLVNENPELVSLQSDLENLEMLFHKFKEHEGNKMLVERLNSKISELKKVIEQKFAS